MHPVGDGIEGVSGTHFYGCEEIRFQPPVDEQPEHRYQTVPPDLAEKVKEERELELEEEKK